MFTKLAQEIRDRVKASRETKHDYNPKLDYLVHFSHGKPGEITPSLAELYDTDPAKAQEVLDDLIRRGRRREGYLQGRKAVEDYMRSRLESLGVNPGYQYPTYAVINAGQDPKLFEGGQALKLPLEQLRDKVTFTIGDSFPVLMHKAKPGLKRPKGPYGRDIVGMDYINRLINSGELSTRLNNLYDESVRRGRKVPMDYIEAQIWEHPEKLMELLKER